MKTLDVLSQTPSPLPEECCFADTELLSALAKWVCWQKHEEIWMCFRSLPRRVLAGLLASFFPSLKPPLLTVTLYFFSIWGSMRFFSAPTKIYYWAGQKVLSGVSVLASRRIWMNFWPTQYMWPTWKGSICGWQKSELLHSNSEHPPPPTHTHLFPSISNPKNCLVASKKTVIFWKGCSTDDCLPLLISWWRRHVWDTEGGLGMKFLACRAELGSVVFTSSLVWASAAVWIGPML